MYAKVFSQIFDSSIADDYRLRHFFTDLLVLADSDGVVDMTQSAIAARTRIPLEDVAEMIARLEQPDPESRTPDADGRRIERMDGHRTWGWHIVNYAKFRQTASDEQRREATRARVARFKAKRQQIEGGNAVVTPANAGNAKKKEKQKEKQKEKHSKGESRPLPPEAEKWNEVCGSIGKVLAMSSDRTRHLAVRLQDPFWVENFEAALHRIVASDFCTGKNDRGWRATFDWLIQQPGSLAKVMEGKYDNRLQTHRPNHSASPARPLTGAEQRQVGIPEVNGGRSLWSVIKEREAARAAADAVAAGEVQHGCDSEGSAANG